MATHTGGFSQHSCHFAYPPSGRLDPQFGILVEKPGSVSIHAPPWEATRRGRPPCLPIEVSTHAPCGRRLEPQLSRITAFNFSLMVDFFPDRGKISTMYQRHLLQSVLDALSDTPAVFIRGPRQSGKTTLVQQIAAEHHPAGYVTLDDLTVLSAALRDPVAFVLNIPKPVIVDEVQRVPDLLLAIKADIDRNRVPGRYLLTGSGNVLTLPRVSDALVGRMEILTLWPLSQGEILGISDDFISRVFSENTPELLSPPEDTDHISERIIRGGFPEPLGRTSMKRKSAWFDAYITTLIERDIRDMSQIQDLAALPRLLQLLATRTASLLNQSEMSRACGLPNSTLGRYLNLLQAIFLIQTLPAWSGNLGKRLVKSPKLFLADTGILCHLLGVSTETGLANHSMAGNMMENFVMCELRKQLSWSNQRTTPYHFRSHTGQEVDLILEDPAGRIVGIEVKLSQTVSSKQFKGLRNLKEIIKDRFLRGIVIYAGENSVPFEDNLFAMPVSSLWTS